MDSKFFSGLALGIALLASSLSAQATPITYTLSGVTFVDHTSATGWFNFDADTHQSSGFDIRTTAGILSPFDWNKSDSGLYYNGGLGPNYFTLITTDGRRVFNFSFVNPLTNAGGTDLINILSTYECNNCGTFRRVTAGSVTSASVPEPGTVWLMLPAFAAIGFAARRRQVRA